MDGRGRSDRAASARLRRAVSTGVGLALGAVICVGAGAGPAAAQPEPPDWPVQGRWTTEIGVGPVAVLTPSTVCGGEAGRAFPQVRRGHARGSMLAV